MSKVLVFNGATDAVIVNGIEFVKGEPKEVSDEEYAIVKTCSYYFEEVVKPKAKAKANPKANEESDE